MASRLEEELDALSAVADRPREQALPSVRKALVHRSNLMVARAAKLALRLDLRELQSELAEAFARFMPPHDAAKLDPQCWAKNELSKTLAAFEAQLPDLFIRGLHHVQMEPVWGGSEDTAGALRGTCALALVQCHELPAPRLLRLLTPLFADKNTFVQINAARAIEKLGTESSALLLRLRAELGSGPPELIGTCIAGVLRLDGPTALPWAAAFIKEPDETSTEAAFALTEYRTPEAAAELCSAYDRTRDPGLRKTLLTAIASTRLPTATDWLLARIRSNALGARDAADALWASVPAHETESELIACGFPRPA